jgi:PAS domain S-box-containing protein
MSKQRPEELVAEIAGLRQQLNEARETLRAITSGEVDALVVNTKQGEKVFTLEGADSVFRIAIENINEGALTLSPEGDILYSNHYFAQMMRTDLNRLIGSSIFSFINPEDREILSTIIRLDSSRLEVTLRAADGTRVPTYFSTSKLLLDTITICAVVTDLTQQKRNQEIISSYMQTDRIKDEFIGLVSHELRTPLTVIIGALRTAMDPRVSQEEASALIRDASASADSLAAILDNMLELSRFQSGRLNLNRNPARISDVAARAINRVRQKYDTHEIILEAPGENPETQFDAIRIEQVFFNLIENAVKYSPAGSVVRVFYKKDGRGLAAGVSDKGTGISTEDQKKIFEPFARLAGTGSNGVGLGLVVCRRLVEAHGGRIWVESEPGKGSTFMFVIP